jgi:glycosyltransferase involved in cell wall biosynthesis
MLGATSPSRNAPAVSVVLPTYNRADTVGRAIESVLVQSLSDLELIVIDDGSTDDSETVFAAFADPRMRVVRNEVNRGVSAARNKGILQSRGQFIAFQDSDDIWRPQKLARQLDRFVQAGDGVGVVGCGWELRGARRSMRTLPTVRGSIYKEILADRAPGLGTPMLLVRRLAEGQPLFDESLPAMVERDFKLQYARQFAFDFVDDVLVEVQRGRADHVANPKNALVSYQRYIEKYSVDLERWPDIRAFYHWRAGREAVQCSDRRAALRYFRSAVTSGHGNLGMWRDAGLGLLLGETGLRISSRLSTKAGR